MLPLTRREFLILTGSLLIGCSADNDSSREPGLHVFSTAGPGLAIVVGDGWAVWSKGGVGVTGIWGMAALAEGEAATAVGEIVGWAGLAVGPCAVALAAGGTVVPVLVGRMN